jgi:hypothetical protein
MLKKSEATSALQCALRKTDHGMPLLRSGAGAMPCSSTLIKTDPVMLKKIDPGVACANS